MKALLNALFTQIKTAPGIAWVDEDFGQIDMIGVQPSVKFPCALVTVQQRHQALGGSLYDVTGTVTVRVAFNRLGDRPAMAPEAAVNLTLDKLVVADGVRDCLEGFESDGAIGMMYLVDYGKETRNDGLSVAVIRFTEQHEEQL